MLSCSWNQDGSAVAFGLETGFQVYSVERWSPVFGREYKGGVGIVEMLYRSSLLALVGGGMKPSMATDASGGMG